jgi:hypothetical protein
MTFSLYRGHLRNAEQEGAEEMVVQEVLVPVPFAGGSSGTGATAAAAIYTGEVRVRPFGDR